MCSFLAAQRATNGTGVDHRLRNRASEIGADLQLQQSTILLRLTNCGQRNLTVLEYVTSPRCGDRRQVQPRFIRSLRSLVWRLGGATGFKGLKIRAEVATLVL